MPTANNPVKFVSTTLANYKALTEKNSDTCYFCSDTNSFFIGDISYSHGIAFFNSTPTTDDVKDLASGTLLIVEPNTSNGNCFEMYYLVGQTITTIGKFENVANKSSKDIFELQEDESYDPTKDNIHYFDGIAMNSLATYFNEQIIQVLSNYLSLGNVKNVYLTQFDTSSTPYVLSQKGLIEWKEYWKSSTITTSDNKLATPNAVKTYVDDKIGNIDTILDSINGD